MHTLSDVLRNASDPLGRSYLRIRPVLILAALALVGCGGPDTGPAAPSTLSATSAGPSSPSPSVIVATASPSLSRTPTGQPSATPSAGTPASSRGGTYANHLSISEDGALSFVPLRWYTGRNAEARCREKGIKPEGAWCGDYYYENAGGRQAAALTEQTKVKLLNDDLKPVDATLAQLVDAVEAEVWPNFQVVVANGKVVRISQVFTP